MASGRNASGKSRISPSRLNSKELEKMLQDLEAASSETPSESTFERAENVYTAGVNVIERGAAVHSQTQSYISMAKAGLELVDQASGGQLAASAARSSAIQRTMKIADQLFNIGSTIPFIAPIFTVLKVIIDVEQKARESASKCEDLLQRINFMTSQLLALGKVKVNEATEAVVVRMEDVLKNAAALIIAYRKQNPIAKRLNMGNKEKFIEAGAAIKDVTEDLMLSLQVQQTESLEVLQRGIPMDPEDEAAEAFIQAHGGENAVKSNPEFVKQFARHMHITIDDDTMAQLNTSISDLMQSHTLLIEQALKENVAAAVREGVRGLAFDLAAANDAKECEEKKTCVQCGTVYRENINSGTACEFHPAPEMAIQNGQYPCCGSEKPCQRRSHRPKHHSEYPYGAFFSRSFQFTNYTDTVDWYIKMDLVDLEKDKDHQKVGVGRLLRWTSGGEQVTEPILVVRVGRVWYNEEYVFHTYERPDIDEMVEMRQVSAMSIGNENTFAMAEWIIGETGELWGMRCSAKVTSSDRPTVEEVRIDFTSMRKIGDTVHISDGTFRPYQAIKPYELPLTRRVGPILSTIPIRKARNDFITRSTSSALDLVITSSSQILANPKWARTSSDNFTGSVSVFNKSQSAPATIMAVKAQYRLIGDKEWSNVESFALTAPAALPVNIAVREATQFAFELQVPRSKKDAQKEVKWWNRALVARHRPLRIKLTVTDVDGESCSGIVEYVFTPPRLQQPNPEDENELGFFFVDDIDLYARDYIRVKRDGSGGIVVGNATFDEHALNRIAYEACKTGKNEVELELRNSAYDVASKKAWALVDWNCKRVYAIKVLIELKQHDDKCVAACMGYAEVPEYGGPKETKEPEYGVESVTFPRVVQVSALEITDEDGLDDLLVADNSKPQPAAASAAIPLPGQSSEAIKLEGLEDAVNQVAAKLERLIEIKETAGPMMEERMFGIDTRLHALAGARDGIPYALEKRLESIDLNLESMANACLAIPPAMERSYAAINNSIRSVTSPPTIQLSPNIDHQIARLNENLENLAASRAAQRYPTPPLTPSLERTLKTHLIPPEIPSSRLESIDRNLSRVAESFETLVGVLGRFVETQNSVEALVGVVEKLADRH